MAEKKKTQFFRPKSRHKADEIWLMSYADLITVLLVFFALMIASSSSIVSGVKAEKIKSSLRQMAQTENTVDEVKKELEKKITEGGLDRAVELVEDDSSLAVILKEDFLFESGKAELKEEGRQAMSDFVKVFNDLPSYARIAFEGYTDDNPINSVTFRSNWQLSVMRAFSVMHEFDRQGICHANCEIRGFGEYRPFKPNRDEEGRPIAANQSENRRVVIRIF